MEICHSFHEERNPAKNRELLECDVGERVVLKDSFGSIGAYEVLWKTRAEKTIGGMNFFVEGGTPFGRVKRVIQKW